VTDNGKPALIVTKSGKRPRRSRADLEKEIREIFPEDSPKWNLTQALKDLVRTQMIYADTSFLLAMRVPFDNFHEAALAYYETNQESVWLWSPWHRVEIFNSLRQLVRHSEAKRRWSSQRPGFLC
jgi:hypothetical protein